MNEKRLGWKFTYGGFVVINPEWIDNLKKLQGDSAEIAPNCAKNNRGKMSENKYEIDEFSFAFRGLREMVQAIHYRAHNISSGNPDHYGKILCGGLSDIINILIDLTYISTRLNQKKEIDWKKCSELRHLQTNPERYAPD